MAPRIRTLILAVLVMRPIHGAPVYTATSVNLNYDSSLQGVGGAQWSFQGPNLNIYGSNAGSQDPLQLSVQLDVPFFVTLPVVPYPGLGASGISGTKSFAGGIDVSDIGLFGSTLLTGGPFVLTDNRYSDSLPVTLTGTIYGCDYVQYGAACPASTADAAFIVNFDVPGLMTVQAASGKYGEIQLTDVSFNSAPETSTLLMSLAGITALLLFRRIVRRVAD